MSAGNRRVALWIGAALSLAGCMLSNVGPDFSPDGQGNRGLLVVSLARTGASAFDLTATVKPVHGISAYTIVIDNNITPKDFGVVTPVPGASPSIWASIPASQPLGRLVVASLPAGDYELSGVSGSPPFITQGTPFHLDSDRLPLRFTVQAGRITYLGSVVFAFPDWINLSQYTGPLQVVATDARERDGKLLKDHYPKLGTDLPERSLTGIPDPSQALHYYVLPVSVGGPAGRGM